jgi:hypothetical protein
MTEGPGFGPGQPLTPPKTRITQAWHLAWQRYYGDAPRKLIQVQRTIIPRIRTMAHGKRIR